MEGRKRFLEPMLLFEHVETHPPDVGAGAQRRWSGRARFQSMRAAMTATYDGSGTLRRMVCRVTVGSSWTAVMLNHMITKAERA